MHSFHADDRDFPDRAATGRTDAGRTAAHRDQHIARLKARIAGLKTAADLFPASESGKGPAPTTRFRSLLDLRQPFPQPTTRNPQPATVAAPLAPASAHPDRSGPPTFSPRVFARRHERPVAGVRYTPRKPENSVIRKVVRENLSSFLEQSEQASGGHRFPRFVVKELADLLQCGDVRRGIALFRCNHCDSARAVPLSCKSRAVCPSCGAKRMTLLSAHLIDHVIPFVPMRFWVMTFPGWLRRKIAYDHALYRKVIAIVDTHISAFYQRQAGQDGIDDGRTGSVHVEQLCGSAVNNNHHDHAAYLDGVFYRPGDDPAARLEFRPADPPADGDIAFIVSKIRYDVLVHLRDRGMLAHDPVADSLADEAPLLLACTDASIQNLLVLGPRAGKGPIRLGADPRAKWSGPGSGAHGRLHAHYDGFDLHAEQLIAARDREGLERALRYATRPPLSEQRLAVLADGRVALTLKNPWSDGTNQILFEPSEFLERLAAIIPRPEKNLLIYRGVLAPNHGLRSLVVRFGRKQYSLDSADAPDANPCPSLLSKLPQSDMQTLLDRIQTEPGQLWLAGHGPADVPALQAPGSDTCGDERPPKRPNYTWATWMERAFAVDVLACPRPGCPGRLRFIACITEPAKIEYILRSLDRQRSAASGLSRPASSDPALPRPPPRSPSPPPSSPFGPLFNHTA